MTKPVLQRLQKMWHGPAIDLKIGAQTFRLGKGATQATIMFKKPSLFWLLFLRPSLTFGEGYMRGDIMIEGNLLAVLEGFNRSNSLTPTWFSQLRALVAYLPVSIAQATSNAQHHYDIGNEFYQLWLDPSQTYTCAYFPQGNETLTEAQFQKRELICRKLRLERGQSLLDIGCGWGSLLFHAAERYGVTATGVTPAREQAAYITAEARRRKVSHLVNVITRDWREVPGTFDRVVSVGMFEQVRPYHYQHFFDVWRRRLSPTGISLLHTITHRIRPAVDPWLARYIFPGGVLPTHRLLSRHIEQAGLTFYRSENLKPHYIKTLQHWASNFTAHREQVVSMFNEQFARMWWLYLQGCEASFAWGQCELWQLELYGPDAPLPINRDLIHGPTR